MNENLLICLVGLPRAGKSSFAEALDCPIVNRDSIRLALHGHRFLREAEEMVAAIAKLMVSALFLAGHTCVVVDETNTTRKRRDNWQSKHWRTVFHVISTPISECLKRAQGAHDDAILPIIEKMAAQFEPLEADELVYEEYCAQSLGE